MRNRCASLVLQVRQPQYYTAVCGEQTGLLVSESVLQALYLGVGLVAGILIPSSDYVFREISLVTN